MLRAAIVLAILVGTVNAQGDWNVYCTTDSECCAVAKQASGNYVVPMLLNPVDWNTAWRWMNANGYGIYGGCRPSAAEVAVWNVYCDGTMKDCVVARQPTPSHANPVLKDQVDWDTAWNEMEETQQKQTETFTVTVDAKKNCIKAGGANGPASVTDGTPLYTDIYLRALERLTITQIDPNAKWSAGPGEERSGNADGLSGFGDYALEGQSFPYGSLVGQIGDSDYFLVGTRYSGDVKQNGVLRLMYWDSNNWDNSGSLKFSIRIVPFEPTDEDPGSEVSSGTLW